MSQNIVIIGAGQAGVSVAIKLRQDGFDGRITMVGDEQALPYQRPPLSKKYLLGDMTLDRLLMKPSSWYEENNIEVLTQTTCTSINKDARTVELGDGRELNYDHLVLTTGSSPIRLPSEIGGDLDGIYTMRDISDADALATELAEGRHMLIVGGGYIGLEAAAVAKQRGLEVTLVEMADRILGRVAAEATADYFRDCHEQHGVKILESTRLETLLGSDGRVSAARLGSGKEVPVDCVVVGIGIRPNTELAVAAGLNIDNGIAVDEFGRTSSSNIFAAGDCASFPWKGKRIRLESVQNAVDQAKNVAINILGGETAYHPDIRFWSDQYDVKLQISGLAQDYDQVVTRAGKKPGSLAVFYYQAEQLLAVDAINDPMTFVMVKKIFDAGASLSPENAANPEFELKQALA